MVVVNSSKKTQGRRKIEIKKIQNKASLNVTFSKRRTGLFNKASELALLCGAQIAILVQSPVGKIFSFGHPSVDSLIHPLLSTADEILASPSDQMTHYQQILARSAYEKAVMRLEMEKRKEKEFWWNEPHDGMELHELEEYLEALQTLKGNVSKRADEEFMKLEAVFGSNDIPSHQEISTANSSASTSSCDAAADALLHNFDLYDFIFK
ncbi:hypothetical protein ACS0TY_025029 [Phlomoides rotata]